ncbi:MAG: autotransporter domain-containing protein [Alphaproteobacteria bacterium]|nr:autotransporter domain-containing protein [Alphaproteobacteria bacterium]
MKYSNTALKELSARYGKILRKCAYLNAVVLTAAMIANPAMAEIISDQTKVDPLYNITSNTTISDSTYTNNVREGTPTVTNGNFGVIAIANNGTLTIKNSTFNGNSSGYVGGALGTSLSGSLSISNATFTNNKAYYDGGAIGNYGGLIISNSLFEGNTSHLDSNGNVVADSTAIGGGAISLGSVSDTTIGSISSTTFKNNRTGQSGGAIATRSNKDGDNTNAKLDISADFIGNSAVVNGGAINNTFFADNGLGKGTGVTISGNFTNNSADGLGGAIFNDTLGIITLNGKNVFSGNTAGGKANDIHNLGTLNISGDLTLDGGITGTGSVEFKEGSTLKTALNNSTSLISGNTVTGTTSLVIDSGTTNATLNMFDASQSGFTFTDNTLYDIIEDEATEGTYNISKKSTDAITETLTSAGVSETTATTVAAVTEAKPATPAAAAIVSAISTAAQTGDTATVAALTEAINPVETPVVQQQSVAVANQIFSVAGDHMSGIGRSGGDINIAVGPWIQGLYNKTHNTQGNGFDGYSQGFALGLDFDVCNKLLWGFGYGYTATDVKSGARKTQIYSDNIFLYGKYQPSKWYVSGIANYGHSNYKETSLGLISKYNVDSYSAAANVGYQSGIFDNYAGLRYSYITPDSYSNGLTTVDGKNSQVGTAVIGTKISKAYKTDGAVWKPEIRLAATYDVKSDNSSSIVGVVGGTTNYMVEGKRLKRFAVEAGAGITTTIARNLDISLNYDANLRSKQTSQSGSVKLKYSF